MAQGGGEMRFGEVCEHGSLKRQCLPCEMLERIRYLRARLEAAEALIAHFARLQRDDDLTEQDVAENKRLFDVWRKVAEKYDNRGCDQ